MRLPIDLNRGDMLLAAGVEAPSAPAARHAWSCAVDTRRHLTCARMLLRRVALRLLPGVLLIAPSASVGGALFARVGGTPLKRR